MIASYNPNIVILSFVVAFIGSYLAISVCELYRHSRVGISEARVFASGSAYITLMAVSLGGVGIWCMHFIGMFALSMDSHPGESVDVRYDVGSTLLSLVLVLLFAGLGAYISSYDDVFSKSRKDIVQLFVGDSTTLSIREVKRISFYRMLWMIGTHDPTYLVLGGICTGAGVVVMHYVGMMAMVFKGRIVWNIGAIAASCIIAVLAATAAFWILFRFLSVYSQREHLRVGCALTMAVAVCGMHYVGMSAATFERDISVDITVDETMSRSQAFLSGVLVAALVGLTAAMVALSELRHTVWKLSYELNRADETITTLPHNNPDACSSQIRRYILKRKASQVGLGIINNTYSMDMDDDDDSESLHSHGEHLLSATVSKSKGAHAAKYTPSRVAAVALPLFSTARVTPGVESAEKGPDLELQGCAESDQLCTADATKAPTSLRVA
jgi:NO-binding membrane sensor protein with MHYT domain